MIEDQRLKLLTTGAVVILGAGFSYLFDAFQPYRSIFLYFPLILSLSLGVIVVLHVGKNDETLERGGETALRFYLFFLIPISVWAMGLLFWGGWSLVKMAMSN